MQLDDVVAAAPLHLGCGILGTLAVGFFAREDYVGAFYGVHPGGEAVCVYMHACIVCQQGVGRLCADAVGT
jgi:ammonia channel protein AmtB